MSTGGTLFWAAVIAIGVAMVLPDDATLQQPPAPAPAPVASSAPAPPRPIGNGFASQELLRGPDGHFYADAQVNGARVRFLIDTGASFVALTREDAQRAGIALGSERAVVMGAGGPFEVTPVTIDRIGIGALSATRVPGAVADDLGVSLLGQSFLAQVGTVEIRGDRMVLR
jgi:aspartyl protease family protein